MRGPPLSSPFRDPCVFDQAFNNSFHRRLESIQYNASLAISGAFRGTFEEEFQQSGRWF